MTFEDLPSDWTTRPLHDPTLCHDIVDLCLSFRDRSASSLLTLFADDQDVPIGTPVLIGGMDWTCDTAERKEGLDMLAAIGPPAALFGISARTPIPESTAQRWLEDAERSCQAADVRFLGFYSVDMEEIRQLSTAPGQ